ncbi:hypothetical protein ACSBM8_11210 [Sphingomonas sp. ASY06-1R]|jgi:hypothetical protein|uniref:hypothetical protein n=1 Tax=Sphingomonas sp. ASY06-1R TaxID=3445771 RepID=UPI003FA238B6
MMRLGLVLGTALLLVTSGCEGARVPQGKQMAQDESLSQDITRRMGLNLPPEARIEHAEDMSGQDSAARMVVVLPDAAWQKILQELTKRAGSDPIFSADENFELGPPGAGWRPAEAANLTTAQFSLRNGLETLNVGLTHPEAGKVRLFLFWFHL